MANDSSEEYTDGLFDDNFSLVSCYFESGDRKNTPGGFESQVDIIISVNMNKFTGYTEEGIINEFYEAIKVTPFNIQNVMRDFRALSGIKYGNVTPDSMYPYFIFRIKTKLTGVYK